MRTHINKTNKLSQNKHINCHHYQPPQTNKSKGLIKRNYKVMRLMSEPPRNKDTRNHSITIIVHSKHRNATSTIITFTIKRKMTVMKLVRKSKPGGEQKPSDSCLRMETLGAIYPRSFCVQETYVEVFANSD